MPTPRIVRAKAEAAPPDLRIAARLLEQADNHLASTGHHIAYLAEAKRLLGPAQEPLLTRVEAARVTRNRAEYQAREVTQSELTDLDTAAHSLVAVARAHVASLGAPPG